MPGFLSLMLQRAAARQELALVSILVLTMAMMILPVPTLLADVLIACNIGLSMMLMMVAVHISSPVEFSTLPSVILITTAFRLSLSITTSRMVLERADAGDIIRTFGDFVIAGNVIVGLVVFLIITVVQFVVITKGSERVAEVAARFTLDALPGKQISIDTDLKNGDIDQTDARRRRRLLERESQLYGAMDGAMKFVKGDAIASLVIIVVNLVGGMAIGCLQRGLTFASAVHTYSLLAVGDGLIAQIPALLVSLTAGVIVTRETSEGGGNLGQDIVAQLTRKPRTLQIAAIVLAGLALVPGFPTAVFLTLAIMLGASGWALTRRMRETERNFATLREEKRAGSDAAVLTVRLGGAAVADLDALERALDETRLKVAGLLGIAVPRLTALLDPALAATSWCLDVDGIPVTQATADETAAVPLQVHAELCRIAERFVGIQETQRLLTAMEPAYIDLVREASKAVPLGRLAEILRRLLSEEVSVTNLRTILEAVAEWGSREANTAIVAEHVRVALRRQICFRIAGASRVLPTVLIEAPLDEALRTLVLATPAGSQLVLDQASSDRLVAILQSVRQDGTGPMMVLASSTLRRHLRHMLARRGVDVTVLTHGELEPDFQLQVLETLRHAQIMPPPSIQAAREPPQLVTAGPAA